MVRPGLGPLSFNSLHSHAQPLSRGGPDACEAKAETRKTAFQICLLIMTTSNPAAVAQDSQPLEHAIDALLHHRALGHTLLYVGIAPKEAKGQRTLRHPFAGPLHRQAMRRARRCG